jgi:hypothetical protein
MEQCLVETCSTEIRHSKEGFNEVCFVGIRPLEMRSAKLGTI